MKNILYRTEIDGLRALAVLSVFFYHLKLDIFRNGFVGVDIFFVISGYLITQSVILDFNNHNFSILKFYNKRIRRIIPALLVTILFSYLISFFLLSPPDLKNFAKSALSSIFFYSNFYFLSEVNYFNVYAELKPLLHTWSLSIEEQYYLILPFIFFSKSIRFFIIIICITTFVSFIFFLNINAQVESKFFLSYLRFWELGLGSFSAIYQNYFNKNIINKQNILLSFFGIFLIFLSLFYLDLKQWPNYKVTFPAFGTFLFIHFCQNNSYLQKFLSFYPLIFIGRRSYSIYLIHYPIITFFYYYFGFEINFKIKLFVFIITICLAILMYKYIEENFRIKNLKKYNYFYNNKNFYFILFFFILIYSLISINIIQKNGFLNKNTKQKLITTASTIKREHIQCKEENIKKCIKDNSNAFVILVGDSNAYHFAGGAKNAIINNTILSLTKGGCLPFSNFTRLEKDQKFNEKCQSFYKQVDEIFTNEFTNNKILIVSAAWLLYLHGNQLYNEIPKSKLAKLGSGVILGDQKYQIIPENQKIDYFENYVSSLIDKYSNKFKKIILIGPLPPQPYAVHLEPSLQFYGHEGTTNDIFVKYSSPIIKIFDNLKKYSNIKIIYPHLKLCNTLVKNRCISFYNNTHYYGDETHVSKIGQYIAYEELFEFLKNLK